MASFDRPLPDWPRSLGHPAAHARLRAEPEDFEVHELPLVTPDGEYLIFLRMSADYGEVCWVDASIIEAAR